MKFVVIYEDRFGRVLHGLTDYWQHTLDRLVADGHVTPKCAKRAEVFEIARRVR